MATDMQATGSGLALYRLTVRQFERMIEAGVFAEGDHVELLGGMLVAMTTNDPHEATLGELGDALRRVLPPDWSVREDKSLRLGRSWRPEPDLAVVRGRHMDYHRRTPRAGDVALVMEVADTSYQKDRGVKWRRYAASALPCYGIVNLPARQFEVYTEPTGRGRSASYQACALYGLDDAVPVVIEGREVGRVAVREILP